VRLPIRARVTAAFAAVSTVLLAAVALIAYLAMGSALQDEIDSGLRFRAVSARQLPPGRPLDRPDPRLQEPSEAFEQVLTRAGHVRRATPGFSTPLLAPAELRAIRRPTFLTRAVPRVADGARLLAMPIGRDVLVVGVSLSDRTDALHELALVLLGGGAVAVLIACGAGWVVAGWTLRPIAVALRRERDFLERAGHELRTPLSALRAEVDLALKRDRTPAELTAALRSVGQETDRLARLAEDLLVLARAGDGRLPLKRDPVQLREQLDSIAARFAARAAESGVTLAVDAPRTEFRLDPMRLRQALGNLIDNALRNTPRGGTVTLRAVPETSGCRIEVRDTGPGFDLAAVAGGPGLGLRIVDAIARAHGGRMAVTRDGGAVVAIILTRAT
jgi:two-component system, OmpR family, sensor kinase